MGGKLAATWHGVECDGNCCKNPHGVCYHGHACAYHLGAGKQRDERLYEQAYTYTGQHRTSAPPAGQVHDPAQTQGHDLDPVPGGPYRHPAAAGRT